MRRALDMGKLSLGETTCSMHQHAATYEASGREALCNATVISPWSQCVHCVVNLEYLAQHLRWAACVFEA